MYNNLDCPTETNKVGMTWNCSCEGDLCNGIINLPSAATTTALKLPPYLVSLFAVVLGTRHCLPQDFVLLFSFLFSFSVVILCMPFSNDQHGLYISWTIQVSLWTLVQCYNVISLLWVLHFRLISSLLVGNRFDVRNSGQSAFYTVNRLLFPWLYKHVSVPYK